MAMVSILIAQSLVDYGALASVMSAATDAASAVMGTLSGAVHAVALFFASIPPTWAATAAILIAATWLFTRHR